MSGTQMVVVVHEEEMQHHTMIDRKVRKGHTTHHVPLTKVAHDEETNTAPISTGIDNPNAQMCIELSSTCELSGIDYIDSEIVRAFSTIAGANLWIDNPEEWHKNITWAVVEIEDGWRLMALSNQKITESLTCHYNSPFIPWIDDPYDVLIANNLLDKKNEVRFFFLFSSKKYAETWLELLSLDLSREEEQDAIPIWKELVGLTS